MATVLPNCFPQRLSLQSLENVVFSHLYTWGAPDYCLEADLGTEVGLIVVRINKMSCYIKENKISFELCLSFLVRAGITCKFKLFLEITNIRNSEISACDPQGLARCHLYSYISLFMLVFLIRFISLWGETISFRALKYHETWQCTFWDCHGEENQTSWLGKDYCLLKDFVSSPEATVNT